MFVTRVAACIDGTSQKTGGRLIDQFVAHHLPIHGADKTNEKSQFDDVGASGVGFVGFVLCLVLSFLLFLFSFVGGCCHDWIKRLI